MPVLTLREAPPERLDFLTINPLALSGLSQGDAERLVVGTTRRGLVLGDCFTVALDGSDTLTIAGGHARLDRVGAGMAGGSLNVTGNAGPFAGAGATGGTITIEGDAGDHAGGAVHATKVGLDGATLVIRGAAGDHLGDSMRRGLIVVERAGARMIAGTIAAGAVGDHPGYGMRRGTLVTGAHGALMPTFVETGALDLVYLRLLAKSLRPVSARHAELLSGAPRRYSGDLATIGKGELWVAA